LTSYHVLSRPIAWTIKAWLLYKRKFSVSFVFRSTPRKGLLHHETARTRAACVSLSLFNNVKERWKLLRASALKPAAGVCGLMQTV